MLALALMAFLGADRPDPGLMRGNLTAAWALQPYLVSPESFRDPGNQDVILACIEQLALTEHPYSAPTPAAISRLFVERVQKARADYERGSKDVARLRLMGLTGLCLGCHTRAPAQATPLHLSAEHLKLAPAERAQLLAAARQFDRALETWKRLLETPPRNALEAYDQAFALRAALGVAVRAADDPDEALALIAPMENRPELAPLTRHRIATWKKDVVAWRSEAFVAKSQRPPALLARARALLDGTGALGSAGPDEDHFVALQRATAYLNRALELEPRAPWRPEALYLLAVAAAAASDPELWQLDELYLEACVRESPHTKAAVRCVDRLADRLVYRYTVEGVTRIPVEEASKLGDLRALAR